MGPVFAFAALALFGSVATLLMFAVALAFLPLRSAVLFAPTVVGAASAGCILGLVAQAPFLPENLPTTSSVFQYLAISGGIGCVCGFSAAAIFLRIRKSGLHA